MTVKNHSIKTARIRDVAELDPETLGESTAPSFTFKYIDLSSVKGGRIGEHVELMTFAAAPGRARKLVKNGDILLGMVRPYLKPFAKVQSAFDGHVASTGFAVIRAKTDVTDREYLYQTIWSDGISKQIHQMVTGSNYPALSVGDVKDLKIPLPPLAEQRKIAEILRTWDEAIETAEAELKAKQDRKRGLMQKLLNLSAEGAGDVSKEYYTVKLGDIAEFSKGKGLPKSAIVANGRHKCVHYGELFTFYGDRINEVISRTDDSDDAVLSADGDILMPTSDVTPAGLAKASCILENDVILGGDIMVIRPDKGRAHPPFLSTYIRFKKKEVLRLAKGTTVFHLYGSDMAKFLVQLPPLAEQRKIAEVLQSEDEAIDTLKAKAELLRAQKRGLMQKLLTGEVRVAA